MLNPPPPSPLPRHCIATAIRAVYTGGRVTRTIVNDDRRRPLTVLRVHNLHAAPGLVAQMANKPFEINNRSHESRVRYDRTGYMYRITYLYASYQFNNLYPRPSTRTCTSIRTSTCCAGSSAGHVRTTDSLQPASHRSKFITRLGFGRQNRKLSSGIASRRKVAVCSL